MINLFSRLRKRFYALPARILAVFIVQAILTIVLLVILWGQFSPNDKKQKLPLLVEDYLARIADDLPQPVTQTYLQQMNRQTGLLIGLETDQAWSVSFGLPNFNHWQSSLEAERWHNFKSHQGGKWHFKHGQVTAQLPTEQGNLWLQFNLNKPANFNLWLMSAIVLLLSMLLITYLWIRYLLKPIKSIQQGAEQYSQGQFSHRLPIETKTDLRELAVTINKMATSIEDRLKREHDLFIAMSHELRTPLARMRLAIEMLDDDSLKSTMLRSQQTMDELITTLLTREQLEQKQTLKLDNIEINSTVLNWLQIDFPDYFSRIKLDIEPNLSVETDAFSLRLILKNLINNALKYSEGDIHLSAKTMGDQIAFKVKDSGIGLEQEDLEQLFSPFFRADKARARQSGGLGLGLYLCQSLAKNIASEISVESEINKGSEFSFSIKNESKDEN